MKSPNRGNRGRARGQTSFEFVLVIAMTLLIVAAVGLDVANESGKSFLLAAVKQSAASQASAAVNENCPIVALRYVSLDEAAAKVTVSFAGGASCQPQLSKVADDVEKLCGSPPNGDSVVDCNPKLALAKG